MHRKTDNPLPKTWSRAIVDYIANHPDRPLKARALARELEIAHDQYSEFRTIIHEMLNDGRLCLGRGRTLELPDRAKTVQGVFRAHPHGDGHIENPGIRPIYVPRNRTRDASDGDRVEARIVKPRRPNQPLRAFITRILESAQIRWVGVLERFSDSWSIRPQGRDVAELVTISNPEDFDSNEGDLVVVEPVARSRSDRHARGRIIENLGDANHPATLVQGVIRRCGYEEAFPPETEREAEKIAGLFSKSSCDDREDLRRHLTITIDPADARDFDDAISLTQLPKDGYELGVHIADVSCFVQPGTCLDRDARQRGTSVYFPDRVIPMLPHTLSSDICCLKPNVPRLTKSVFITYDKSAQVVGTRFANSVIRSGARLTYDEVTDVLDGRNEVIEENVRKLLRHAERLARRILKRRLTRGMLVLNAPELEIKLLEDGTTIDARPADRAFSHTIIEMFMVEANEAVSRMLSARGIQHLRRIHPDPEVDDLDRLSRICNTLGFSTPAKLERGAIQALLQRVQGSTAESTISLLLLRSLAQASYSPAPVGHFALASNHYCHFTSPIRRYPDLTVHRLFQEALDDGETRALDADNSDTAPPDFDLGMLGAEMSSAERRAQQAERDARYLLALHLMKSSVGRVFDGIVTGMSKAGVFVQLQPILVDGLVPLEYLGDSDWSYDSDHLRLINEMERRAITIGMPVRVVVDLVDEIRQRLWLLPAKGQRFGLPSADVKKRGRSKVDRRCGKTGKLRGRTRRGRR